MRNKQLHPETIISNNFYIERQADKHLQNSILYGGRPPYILVSRQMGKTNLLLHTKARMEDDQNVFVYIDLSTKFDDAASCFRNIIDTAITSRANNFSHLIDRIEKNRDKKLPPHKEHEAELLLLLNEISGKLVIILDEVDSLKTQSYSDQLFAQIRSTYFSRTNFAQFNRLLHVLSGVAEPSDLIKDKNISPFNIGEKIYLDDFSRDEFNRFIQKANLQFENDIADRIYYWSNGNPRMTWDICSYLEKYLLTDQKLTVDLVDQEVANMYLGQFDLAPVDHIRNIVQEDEDLLDALIVIRFKKGNTLSDRIKSKLFLAGIIQAPLKDKPISIKNPIIDLALSDQWIEEITKAKKPLWKVALEKFDAGLYTECISIIEENLDTLPTSIHERKQLLFTVGLSNFYLKKYTDALKWFVDSCPDSPLAYPSEYYDSIYHQGLCHYSLNNLEAAEVLLRKAKESPVKERTYFSTKVDLAVIISKKENNRVEAITLLTEVKNEIFSTYTANPPDNFRDILLRAAIHLSRISRSASEKNNAIATLDEIIHLSKPAEKIPLLFQKMNLRTEGKRESLAEIQDNIISSSLIPTKDLDSVAEFDVSLLPQIFRFAFNLDKQIFERLIAYFKPYLSNLDYTVQTFCENLLDNADPVSASAMGIELHKQFSALVSNNLELLYCYRVGLLTNSKSTNPMFLEYRQVIRENASLFSTLDLLILFTRIDLFYNSNMFGEAIKTSEVIKSITGKNEDLRKYLCLAQYQDARILAARSEPQMAKHTANLSYEGMLELYKEKQNSSEHDDTFITKDFLDGKISALKSYLYGAEKKTPAKSEKTHKPNDKVIVRYPNGNTVNAKYKKVSEDIQNGLCVLLPSNETSD